MTEQTEIHTEQNELFPKTQRELANEFLEHFQADVEKAEKSLVTARRNLREAIVLRDDAEENLRRIIASEGGTVVDTSAEEEVEDAEVLGIEAAPAQLEPGEEVEDAEVVEEDDEGEDPMATLPPDESQMAEPAPAAMVWVAWPDTEESISLVVGPLTRFGELVANYLNANPDCDFLAKYVISDAEGTTYDAKSVIGSENYGREYFIEREVALKKEEA